MPVKTVRQQPVFTNLGMHFVQAGTGYVLVQVEVNVRGLLAVHARRLIKSKRALATASSGTVRMSIATPEGQEHAAAAHALQSKAEDYDRMAAEHAAMSRENSTLRRQMEIVYRMLKDRELASEYGGSGI